MTHGIASASLALIVKFHWLDSASLVAMSNLTVPTASENCSLSDAQLAPSQSLVRFPWNHHLLALNSLQFGCFRHRWHTFHLIRRPSLAQRLLHLRHLQVITRWSRIHLRWRGRHYLSRLRQGKVDGLLSLKPINDLPDSCFTFFLAPTQRNTFIRFVDFATIFVSRRSVDEKNPCLSYHWI